MSEEPSAATEASIWIRAWRTGWLGVPVALILLTSSTVKFVEGHSSDFVLGPVAYFATAFAELLLAAAILARPMASLHLQVVVGHPVGGVVLSLLVPDRPCGCFGSLVADPAFHRALAGLTGFLAVLNLMIRKAVWARQGWAGGLRGGRRAVVAVAGTALLGGALAVWLPADVPGSEHGLEQSWQPVPVTAPVRTVEAGWSADRVDLGRRLLVEVADARHRPIAGATVEVHETLRRSGGEPIAVRATDQDGLVSLQTPDLGGGRARHIVARARGFASAVVTVADQADRISLVLQQGHDVRVVARDSLGRPVSGVRIALSPVVLPPDLPDPGLSAGGAGIDCVSTDATGTATALNLAAGRYYLSAAHPSHAFGGSSVGNSLHVPATGFAEVVMVPLVGAAVQFEGEQVVTYFSLPLANNNRTVTTGASLPQATRRLGERHPQAQCLLADVMRSDGNSDWDVDVLSASTGWRRYRMRLRPIDEVELEVMDPDAGTAVAEFRCVEVELRCVSGDATLDPHGLVSLMATGAGSGDPRDRAARLGRSMFRLRHGRQWLPMGEYRLTSSDPLLSERMRLAEAARITVGAAPEHVIDLGPGLAIKQIHASLDGVTGFSGGRLVFYGDQATREAVLEVPMERPERWFALPVGSYWVVMEVGGMARSEATPVRVDAGQDAVSIPFASGMVQRR